MFANSVTPQPAKLCNMIAKGALLLWSRFFAQPLAVTHLENEGMYCYAIFPDRPT